MNEYIKLDIAVALYCIFHQKYFVCGLLACNSLCPECQLRYQNSEASGVKVCHDIEFLLSFVLRNCPQKSSIQKAVSFPGKTNCRGWKIITPGIPDNGDIKLAWKEKIGWSGWKLSLTLPADVLSNHFFQETAQQKNNPASGMFSG